MSILNELIESEYKTEYINNRKTDRVMDKKNYSVFASQRGIVLACDKLENKKESEIYTVQRLLQALDIQDEIITLDALHCQKNS